MSVEDPSTVDLIGTEKGTGRIILTISDHLPWADEDHLVALENKIGAYVDFVESGQLLETRPAAHGQAVEIRLVCQFTPDAGASRFIDMAREQLEARGLTFSWKVLPPDH